MRAFLCHNWGEAQTMKVEETSPPQMTEDGVRIAVKAAGVNFADTLMIKGEYQVRPSFPFSPGLEIAGEVLECAPSVKGVQPGDRVMAMTHYGGYANEAVAPARDVIIIPDSMDYTVAAGFPIAYGTSHIGLTDKLDLQPGETLLVHGAAGGVGLTAVEIAKKIGATVIATAGDKDKLKIAEKYGADHLIDYREEDIRERVKQVTDGRGADAVYDPVGGSAFNESLRCTAQRGRILVVGFASGNIPQIPANILLVKNLSVIGYYWGAHRELDPELVQDSFVELIDWFEDGELTPHVSNTFELADAAEAMEMLKTRKSTGKVVLTMETRH
ncbi:MAG: zinc-binding dehydrogenase [Rhodospirillaceae bacterium TMED8]|nr:zinc-binding dehydrogenase [Magnetovibrio sp.]OUT51208.1 MAG: zinc-binding dehydrogenase [Rhodospirillaceae bacterium TMED8]|tara:strand:+ start:2395 stop:3381 length:987 start_codon:yes stop_codon:yes gene_type:complete